MEFLKLKVENGKLKAETESERYKTEIECFGRIEISPEQSLDLNVR
jgi:hypothetical protein